ncbi:unnamed protein product, partial [Adineta steineri]
EKKAPAAAKGGKAAPAAAGVCCNSLPISSSLNLRGVFDDLPVCDLVTGPFCSIIGLKQDIKDLNKNEVLHKQHERKLEKEIEELLGEESDVCTSINAFEYEQKCCEEELNNNKENP